MLNHCHLYSIQGLDISKVSNECPEPNFNSENGLYDLEEVNSVYQTFHGHRVLWKCKGSIGLIFMSRRFPTGYKLRGGEITHKLEQKGLQAIHSLEGLRAPNQNQFI